MTVEPGRELQSAASDVPAKGIVLGGIGLLIFVLVSGAIVAGLFLWFDAGDRRPSLGALEAQRIVPPEPRLEVDPARNRAIIEGVARKKISEFGWANRGQGRARIPIDQAMDLLAARGWPDAEGQP